MTEMIVVVMDKFIPLRDEYLQVIHDVAGHRFGLRWQESEEIGWAYSFVEALSLWHELIELFEFEYRRGLAAQMRIREREREIFKE